jgi:hypothetical protein
MQTYPEVHNTFSVLGTLNCYEDICWFGVIAILLAPDCCITPKGTAKAVLTIDYQMMGKILGNVFLLIVLQFRL